MTDPKRTYLDFERPIAEIEAKIEELETAVRTGETGVDAGDEIAKLRAKAKEQLEKTYANLTAWQKTQVARHPGRPHFADYQASLIEMFTELAGDRSFGDDPAIMGGLGWIGGSPVVVLGHEKGRDTAARVRHNFGMARPEGYRKAVRLMDLADRFGAPVITFVDTAGAYPGKGAEERGQAEAIARCTERCLTLGVPLIAVITGEGGSGGAVALASANSVLMLEHSIYSVITPEGCASILWRDSAKSEEAAEAMKITAANLQALRVVDRVVKEPTGGAHRDPAATIRRVGEAVRQELKQFSALSPDQLRAQRRDRFLAIGRGDVSL
jgi:acetyl-CoA carboxylase carboxyl transferase subunit alpha